MICLMTSRSTAGKLSLEKEHAVFATIPRHRWGTTDEVASAIAYLVSDDASYVTGSTYEINGGLHIH